MTISLAGSFQQHTGVSLDLPVTLYNFDFDNVLRQEPNLIIVHRKPLAATRLTYTSTSPPPNADEYTIKDYVPSTKLGTIEINTAMLVDESILSVRSSPITQDTSYTVSGRFPSAAAEALADLHVKKSQEGVPFHFSDVLSAAKLFPVGGARDYVSGRWKGLRSPRTAFLNIRITAAIAAATSNGVQGVRFAVHSGVTGTLADPFTLLNATTTNTDVQFNGELFHTTVHQQLVISSLLITISAQNLFSGAPDVDSTVAIRSLLEITESIPFGIVEGTHT